MLRQDEAPQTKSFENLSLLFYGSFLFSMAANSISSLLTIVYVDFGLGRELNLLMVLELRIFGLWVLPLHALSILAYYTLFYLTIKRTSMTETRIKLWSIVLLLIPILSAFDLAFDLNSAF